jgi:hypothetical protein
VPRLEGSWRYAASRKELEVVLRQTQAGEVYRLSVELGLAHRGGGALEDGGEGLPPGAVRVELRGREETFRLAAERAPQDVVVDPGTWLLAEGMALRRR